MRSNISTVHLLALMIGGTSCFLQDDLNTTSVVAGTTIPALPLRSTVKSLEARKHTGISVLIDIDDDESSSSPASVSVSIAKPDPAASSSVLVVSQSVPALATVEPMTECSSCATAPATSSAVMTPTVPASTSCTETSLTTTPTSTSCSSTPEPTERTSVTSAPMSSPPPQSPSTTTSSDYNSTTSAVPTFSSVTTTSSQSLTCYPSQIASGLTTVIKTKGGVTNTMTDLLYVDTTICNTVAPSTISAPPLVSPKKSKSHTGLYMAEHSSITTHQKLGGGPLYNDFQHLDLHTATRPTKLGPGQVTDPSDPMMPGGNDPYDIYNPNGPTTHYGIEKSHLDLTPTYSRSTVSFFTTTDPWYGYAATSSSFYPVSTVTNDFNSWHKGYWHPTSTKYVLVPTASAAPSKPRRQLVVPDLAPPALTFNTTIAATPSNPRRMYDPATEPAPTTTRDSTFQPLAPRDPTTQHPSRFPIGMPNRPLPPKPTITGPPLEPPHETPAPHRPHTSKYTIFAPASYLSPHTRPPTLSIPESCASHWQLHFTDTQYPTARLYTNDVSQAVKIRIMNQYAPWLPYTVPNPAFGSVHWHRLSQVVFVPNQCQRHVRFYNGGSCVEGDFGELVWEGESKMGEKVAWEGGKADCVMVS
ncbi:MAG: hypothetical protein M1828_007429 [Chrysothrix sp. TS-e1954]|nr:MAG: hypothetical protein M1828_007429 [Chrysothrix sp. TS-e1954]